MIHLICSKTKFKVLDTSAKILAFRSCQIQYTVVAKPSDLHHENYNPSRKAKSNMQEGADGPMIRARANQLQRAMTNQIAMIEAASELKISNQFEIGSRVLI